MCFPCWAFSGSWTALVFLRFAAWTALQMVTVPYSVLFVTQNKGLDPIGRRRWSPRRIWGNRWGQDFEAGSLDMYLQCVLNFLISWTPIIFSRRLIAAATQLSSRFEPIWTSYDSSTMSKTLAWCISYLIVSNLLIPVRRRTARCAILYSFWCTLVTIDLLRSKSRRLDRPLK